MAWNLESKLGFPLFQNDLFTQMPSLGPLMKILKKKQPLQVLNEQISVSWLHSQRNKEVSSCSFASHFRLKNRKSIDSIESPNVFATTYTVFHQPYLGRRSTRVTGGHILILVSHVFYLSAPQPGLWSCCLSCDLRRQAMWQRGHVDRLDSLFSAKPFPPSLGPNQ